MTRQEQVEPSSSEPVPSRIRLALLVLEGYAYLALVIASFVAVVAFLVWGVLNRRPLITVLAILTGVPLTVITARAIYTLFVTMPAPEGIAITARRGPRLRALVEDVRRRIGAPRVHRILVTDTFNASALQVARAGVFWPRNTLLLGYPLLATLSSDQLRAVIAHELGHITHAHGRFSSWVYRTRVSWLRLIGELESRSATPGFARRLFRWYVPRLIRASLAVSRRQELLADRLAADVTGSDMTAQALVACEIGERALRETFWPRIFQSVHDDPEPPGAFSRMGPDVWRSVRTADHGRLLDQLLETDPSPYDTHPPLRDRLTRIGQQPKLPAAVVSTAADELLAEHKDEIVAALDDDFRAARADDWRRRHEELRANRARLAELDAVEQPTPQQIFEHGVLNERVGDQERALSRYRSALAAGHYAAGLAVGRILLERGDDEGLPLIEAAMVADVGLVAEGCEGIAAFLQSRGRNADAHRYLVRAERARTHARMAIAERRELSVVDRFVPCGPEIDRLRITSHLAEQPVISRAFLAGKRLRHSAGIQTVLALVTKRALAPPMLAQLRRDCQLPDDAFVVVLGRHDQLIEAALTATAGALVYENPAA